jgi:hypothetical protein
MIEDEVHRTGAMSSPLFRGFDVKQAREQLAPENLPRLPPLFSSRHQQPPAMYIPSLGDGKVLIALSHSNGACRNPKSSRAPALASGQKCKKWQRILIKAEGAFSLGQPLSRRTGDWAALHAVASA